MRSISAKGVSAKDEGPAMIIVVCILHSVECWMSDLSFALESSNSRQCHGWHGMILAGNRASVQLV